MPPCFQPAVSLIIFLVGIDKRIVHSRHCLSTLGFVSKSSPVSRVRGSDLWTWAAMWQVCSDRRIKPEINRDTRDNAVFASCRHWGSASARQIWRLHGGVCHELDPLTPTPK
jgi:hypothetical protein